MKDTYLKTAATADKPWPLLILLMALTAIGPLTLNIMVPALPNMAVRLGTDTATVQLTLSLFLLSLAGAQLVLGPLSDRYGRRPVMLWGLAVTVIASLAAVAATSIGALIVARIIQAAGAATGVVIGRAIIRDLFDRDRAAAMLGLVTTAMVIAPMVAPLIGGLLDTMFGWEASFLFTALFAALLLVWTTLRLPETRPQSIAASPGKLWHEWRALLKSREYYGYMLCGALGSASFFTFLGGGPHVVVTIMGRSSAEYGMWFAIMSLGYMAGNFTVSRLAQRYGVNAVILTGIAIHFAGTCVTLTLVSLYPDGGPATVFVPQFVISYGSGLLLPNAMAGAVSVRPQAAGTAAGLAGFVQMAVGAAAAQIVSMLLAGSTTALPLAWMMLGAAVSTAVAYAVLVRR
ncbi:MAG: multidrug effflux MFS transporter [Pseudolabrys sp.]|nr:multidrug effflux MFS transporter [Pseudolabrys sp.]